jgi:uncharacterized protein YcbK (DUF882 family)
MTPRSPLSDRWPQRLCRWRGPRLAAQRARVAALLGLFVWGLLGATPAAARVVRRIPLPAPVDLYALNTRESYRLQPGPRGRLDRRLLSEMARFLRCHHTGKVHPVSPLLVAFLYQVGRHFAGHRILVVAGYRAPQVAIQKGNPRSHHRQGLACDFRVEGRTVVEVRDWLRRTYQRVGVGFYPNANFVHLDVGRKKSGYWVDLSSPGQRPVYSSGGATGAKEEEAGDDEDEGARVER